jgi:WhiB family redox-sensing transcriptional regulator
MSLEHISYIDKSYSETKSRFESFIEYSWQESASCKGLNHLFFAPPSERPDSKNRREAAAKAICAVCPVVKECLNQALENREQGIWGNTNDEERFVKFGVKPFSPTNSRIYENRDMD